MNECHVKHNRLESSSRYLYMKTAYILMQHVRFICVKFSDMFILVVTDGGIY
jgi:hypothetical protein